jgi:putative glycosyltransferase (TIGR04348 family)
LKIVIATPGDSRLTTGNRVTAQRWARILRGLGHLVSIVPEWRGGAGDVLVALHARKSFPSIDRFRRERPEAPLVVALTGTDLYGDIRTSARARRALALATRVIVLQREGLRELPLPVRAKAAVIFQSALPPPRPPAPRRGAFEICFLCHARPVKDPFRAALATRRLPASSRVRLLHVGSALDPGSARRVRDEARRNPRYRWFGALPRWRALRLLARSRLLVLTSRLEGASNAISEALACDVPVISSRIPGVMGTLSRGYPGYFPVGDTRALARLMHRAETNRPFYEGLKLWCRKRAHLVAPAAERRAWASLLRELWLRRPASSSRPIARRARGRSLS